MFNLRQFAKQIPLTEKQLRGHSTVEPPAQLTQKQLDDYRTEDEASEHLIEKNLQPVRHSAGTQKSARAGRQSPIRTAATDKKVLPTETRLRQEEDNEAPQQIHEQQLDGHRANNDDFLLNLIQKNLDGVRTEEADRLSETRLENAKGGFHQHRNPKTSEGNINQIEAQRLKDKKRQETEKQELASETPKDQRFWEAKPGKDGIKLAQVDAQIDDTFAIHLNPDQEFEDRLTRQELKERRRALRESLQDLREPIDEFDPLEDLLEEDNGENIDLNVIDEPAIESRESHEPIQPNPEGPASDSMFEDVPTGESTNTGTDIEERALLFDRNRSFFRDIDDDQIGEVALQVLRRKYPDRDWTDADIEVRDRSDEVGEVIFTVMSGVSA